MHICFSRFGPLRFVGEGAIYILSWAHCLVRLHRDGPPLPDYQGSAWLQKVALGKSKSVALGCVGCDAMGPNGSAERAHGSSPMNGRVRRVLLVNYKCSNRPQKKAPWPRTCCCHMDGAAWHEARNSRVHAEPKRTKWGQTDPTLMGGRRYDEPSTFISPSSKCYGGGLPMPTLLCARETKGVP